MHMWQSKYIKSKNSNRKCWFLCGSCSESMWSIRSSNCISVGSSSNFTFLLMGLWSSIMPPLPALCAVVACAWAWAAPFLSPPLLLFWKVLEPPLWGWWTAVVLSPFLFPLINPIWETGIWYPYHYAAHVMWCSIFLLCWSCFSLSCKNPKPGLRFKSSVSDLYGADKLRGICRPALCGAPITSITPILSLIRFRQLLICMTMLLYTLSLVD